MKITDIEIKNFLSIDHIFTTLDRPGLNLVLGDNKDNPAFSNNGSGKSAFFEAVIWGLFGEIVRDVSIDDLVRKGEKELFVGLTVDPENGDPPIYISRQRYDKKTAFIVRELSSKQLQLFPSASAKEKQKLLDNWLGIDYNTFINSVYFGKGLTKFFMTSNDNDRKEVLESILQLISFDKPFEKAKDALKLLLIEEDRLKGELSYYEKWANEADRQLNAVLSEKQLLMEQDSKAAAAVEEATKILNKVGLFKVDIDILDDYIGSLHRKQAQALDILKQETKVRSCHVIDEYNEAIKALDSAFALEQSKIQKEYDEQKAALLEEEAEVLRLSKEAKDKFSFYSDALAISRAEVKRNKDEINKVRDNRAGTKCPKCYNNISEEHIASVVAGFERAVVEAEKQVESLIVSCANVTETMLAPIEAALSELAQEKEKILLDFNKKIGDLKEKIEVKKREALEKKSKAEKIVITDKNNRERELVSEIRVEIDSNTQEKTNKLLEIKDLERKHFELQSFSTNHYKLMSSVDGRIADQQQVKMNAVNKIAEFVASLKAAQKEKPLLEFTVEAFSPKGIRSLIFENALPFITERANHYSTYLTGGTVKIDISPTTITKTTGEAKEKLSVSAKNTLGAEVYSGNSAGESKRIDVCILLALQDLIGTRSTKTWNLMIMDEIMDSLDTTGIQNLIDLFRNNLGSKSIYLISHNSDIKQYFDESLLFIKEGGISRLNDGN